MLPDLTVLIALLVGIASLSGSPASPGRALLGSALCFLVGTALSRMASNRGLRYVDDGEPLMAEAQARWATLWPFVAWLGALIGFEWGAWVEVSVPRTLWLVRYVVLLAPLVGMYALAWAGRAEVEGELLTKGGGVSPPNRARLAIRAGFRRNGIVLLPLLIIIGLTEAMWLAGELGIESLRIASQWAEAMPLLQVGFMLVLILLTLPFLPRLIARMIHAETLAPGALRTRLERAAAAVDLRYGDIRIWRTGGRVLNAMVIGFTPRSRIIFLTDGLLEALSEDEVLAVFFHEAGHAKRHHLPLFMVLFFSLSLLFHGLRFPLASFGIPPALQMALHLGVLWFVLLGWISRRFERESDIYGADHAAVLSPDAPDLMVPDLPMPLARGAALMVLALKRLKTVAGYAGSHRHGSIDDRMAFVTQYALDPEVRQSFRGGMRNLKLGIMLVAVAAVSLTVWRMPLEVAQARATIQVGVAEKHYKRATKLAGRRDGTVTDVLALRTAWQASYDEFLSTLALLEGREDVEAKGQRIQSRFAAGDIAMHGLRDADLAKPHFEAVLALLEDDELNGPQVAVYRFESHVELGRIAAWHYRELPVGDAQRDTTAMRGHLRTARKLRDFEMHGLDPDRTQKDDAFLAERARLLAATIDAVVGEHELARKELTRLVKLRNTAKDSQHGRLEIAEDAAFELERLPPAPAPPAPPADDD